MSEHFEEHAPHIHITPVSTYLIVFFALVVGTILTWLAADADLGVLNTPIALAIAGAKAVLVILYFMHVKYSTRLTWVTVIGSFLFLGILFVFTLTDYLTRNY
jgi:cytochrome c oxidase subunit 4